MTTSTMALSLMLSSVLTALPSSQSQPPVDCRLGGAFYRTTAPSGGSDAVAVQVCVTRCLADVECGGFTYKKIATPAGPGVDKTVNCTATAGQPCCYFQRASDITDVGQTTDFECWQKPGVASVTLSTSTSSFPHFWTKGINSPHSAMTLREDWRSHMRYLKTNIGYNYTRIHAPFARDYSVAQGPNATSMFNPFSTYDALIAMGVKPWIELGYTPCYISGPPAVPENSYWPTVDYGICVGPPTSIEAWTSIIDAYVAACVERYGVAEVETWVWVLYNEPGGINAFSPTWEQNGFTYYDLFWNTSATIKKHSPNMTVGGLSDGAQQGAILAQQMADMPARRQLLDLFSYHRYCNGETSVACGASQVQTVEGLRKVLPDGLPIFLEETGSSAGPYDPTHDETFEAAFVVPYVAAMATAQLAGSHWWVSSDLYTEHGSIPNYTWIPNENYSGGMPRAEFTGRWGFITPNGIPKPITRAFELLAHAGTDLISTTTVSSNCSQTNVVAVANTTDARGGLMVFLTNEGNQECAMTISLGPWVTQTTQGWQYSITAGGAGDPKAAWVQMGSPPFPTVAQVTTLFDASVPAVTAIQIPSNGKVTMTVSSQSLTTLSL
eukprot:m.64191 g.64191  ORF g.64191 m.64191 type:complete len:610 (+) comp8208_c0_seq1:61-1890(+)